MCTIGKERRKRFREAKERSYDRMVLLDIGGGFSAPYDDSVKPFSELAVLVSPPRFTPFRMEVSHTCR
ncbi:MAG: hypothetical protein WCP20_23885 [Desulfuromonadales bacterium]